MSLSKKRARLLHSPPFLLLPSLWHLGSCTGELIQSRTGRGLGRYYHLYFTLLSHSFRPTHLEFYSEGWPEGEERGRKS